MMNVHCMQIQFNEITMLARLDGARQQLQRVNEQKVRCEAERTRLEETVARLKRLEAERDQLLRTPTTCSSCTVHE